MAELESLYSHRPQRMINPGLEAEMDAHLGYGHGERCESGNGRNGKSRKRVLQDQCDLLGEFGLGRSDGWPFR